MSNDDLSLNALIEQAGDRAAPSAARIEDILRLGESDDDVARKALLNLAARDEAAPIESALGVALARQYVRRGDLLEAPLAAFTTESGNSFDNEVGRLQHQSE
jgi:hypothetical protein